MHMKFQFLPVNECIQVYHTLHIYTSSFREILLDQLKPHIRFRKTSSLPININYILLIIYLILNSKIIFIGRQCETSDTS
jgi:hypothetical protein